MTILFLTGCLLDKQGYLDRRAQLVDDDEDGFAAMEDCGDDDPAVFPGADEVCDGVDQDCDEVIDEDALDAPIWYVDGDGDGHGDAAEPVAACAQPEGTATEGDDCNDANSQIFPGASEVPYDDVDQDCADGDLVDVDQDGVTSVEAGGEDCDDTDDGVQPGADEIPYDGVDQDCEGGDLDDLDGDGFVGTEAAGDDCDDADPNVFPAAEETWANGYTDNDCDEVLESATLEYGSSAWLGEREGAQLGRRLSSLGDVTGDGLAEYLAVALYDDGQYENGGAVYLLGAGSGSVAGENVILAEAEGWYLGASVVGGPDVDADGWPDLAVSASGYANARGRTWIISGATFAASSALSPELQSLGTITGDTEGTVSGLSIAFLGDLSGDGREWLGVSEPFATVGANAEAGKVGLFGDLEGAYGLDEAEVTVGGYYASGHLGSEVFPAGDQDGDGLDDYLVSTDTGDVAAILPGGLDSPVLPDDAIFRLTRSEAGAGDREDVRMIGDVDGDGRGDLLSIHNNSSVQVFTYLSIDQTRVVEDAWSSVDYGSEAYAYDTVNLGDLDGDGREETLLPIGQYGSAGGSYAAIWPGEFVTPDSARSIDEALLAAVSTDILVGWGYRATVSGDVDGDGAEDIVIGGCSDSRTADHAGAILTIPVPR